MQPLGNALADWLAGQVITGASVSFTVTRNEQVLVRPAASVARQITVVWPFGKTPPLGRPLCKAAPPPAQLSE